MNAIRHAAGWRSCFPALADYDDNAVSVIEDGWDFQIVRVDDVGVRVPRRGEVEKHARVEARMLPELARRLPVQVPAPQEFCEVHGSMIYAWIPGHPASDRIVDAVGAETLAVQLAAFVSALHRFPPERAREHGVADGRLLDQVDRFDAHVLPLLANKREPERLLAQAREHLGSYEPRLVHGDLGPAHLLCDDQGLAAVIDWTDLALGDPAQDATWILNGLDQRLRAPFLAALPLDDDLVARADIIHRLGPWWEVLYGLEQQRPGFVESGMAGIEERLRSAVEE